MSDPIMADATFRWLITGMTAGLSGAWLVVDAIRLARVLREDRREPLVRDRLFGYALGVIMGAIGLFGVLRFHDVV